MNIIVFIILGVVSSSGWIYALYINDSWFKDSIKTTDAWFKRCNEINDFWYERNVELAKKVDELTAERRNNNDQT